MSRVHVSSTPSGYLPVHSWGEGENMDRQAYAMSYRDLDVAERVARKWANDLGADYVASQKSSQPLDPRLIPLIKKLREEHGLDLREGIRRAEAILAEDPAAT